MLPVHVEMPMFIYNVAPLYRYLKQKGLALETQNPNQHNPNEPTWQFTPRPVRSIGPTKPDSQLTSSFISKSCQDTFSQCHLHFTPCQKPSCLLPPLSTRWLPTIITSRLNVCLAFQNELHRFQTAPGSRDEEGSLAFTVCY